MISHHINSLTAASILFVLSYPVSAASSSSSRNWLTYGFHIIMYGCLVRRTYVSEDWTNRLEAKWSGRSETRQGQTWWRKEWQKQVRWQAHVLAEITRPVYIHLHWNRKWKGKGYALGCIHPLHWVRTNRAVRPALKWMRRDGVTTLPSDSSISTWYLVPIDLSRGKVIEWQSQPL